MTSKGEVSDGKGKTQRWRRFWFTVPLDADESTEHSKIYILERETTPLTKLIPRNS
ncbi:hypothetical protein LC653_22530 [Nostoc sp. CHAB 5784]|uniref:hypothetical protein n=1 Tax=Nostoc mirabile TaxID=2907820 RepID=UPI001E3505D0|nr:hypothetical protein [Nostoc mirabile]MCC5666586.1 hypothetical protein [Nostoc mirabile CHAB5784]